MVARAVPAAMVKQTAMAARVGMAARVERRSTRIAVPGQAALVALAAKLV
jgi:hypothetical protein